MVCFNPIPKEKKTVTENQISLTSQLKLTADLFGGDNVSDIYAHFQHQQNVMLFSPVGCLMCHCGESGASLDLDVHINAHRSS